MCFSKKSRRAKFPRFPAPLNWCVTCLLFSCLASVSAADSSGRNFGFYGSVRVHVDAARVDEAEPGQDSDYVGARDAYSRVGIRGNTSVANLNIAGTLEFGINTADFDLGDPSFFDDQNFRVASVNLSGDFGTITLGKDWLPFYNAVAAPVDLFSSVYAGFSTYAFFRENQLSFASNIGNLDYAVAAISRTGSNDRGWQATLTYPIANWTLAIGAEIMEADISDTSGASATWSNDDFYTAAKFEYNTSDGFIYNWFGQYSLERTAFKLGVGLGDQFSGTSWHIGVDYQLIESLSFFAEIYAEERNYAILEEGAERADQYLGAGGFGARQNGRAIALGARFDF